MKVGIALKGPFHFSTWQKTNSQEYVYQWIWILVQLFVLDGDNGDVQLFAHMAEMTALFGTDISVEHTS